MSALVVGGGDGLEPLLPSSVPDLELDCGTVGIESSNLEINTNGGQEATSEERYLSLKMLSENLRRRLDFPTEEFPMSRSLKR